MNFTLNSNVASAQNYGRDGASTALYVKDGEWANILNITETSAMSQKVYVTLQFGHNDEKLGITSYSV